MPGDKVYYAGDITGPAALMSKSATFVWELMFTRAMYDPPDMIEQHQPLNAVAALIDEGKLRTTVGVRQWERSTPPICGRRMRS